MDSPGVPQYKIARLSAHLDRLAASLLEPVDFFWGKSEPINWAPSLSLRLMSLEEGFVESAGSLQDDKSSVPGAVLGKIEYPLDTLQSFAVRALVHVGPCTDVLSVFCWEGQVCTIE